MSRSQDRWVLAAIVVSESAWLFAVSGVVAVALGRDGSPLGWLAMLWIMGLSLLVARFSPSKVAAIEVVQLIRTLLGAALVYLTVATQVSPGAISADLLWIGKIFSEYAPDGYTFKALAGSLIGLLLWWRTGRLPAVEFPIDSLAFSFRIGLLALALATAVDIVHPADLHTFPMIFIFFAAGLAGLGIGHLLPESKHSAKARTWPKVIAGVVSTILVIGLALSLLNRGALAYLSAPALGALNALVDGIFWGIVIPVAFVFNLFVEGLIRFFDRVFAGIQDEEPSEFVAPAAQDVAAAMAQEEEEGAGLFYMIIQIIEWAFLAVVALLILYLLVKAVRRWLAPRPEPTLGRRESVREGATPLSDIAKLLLNLIPDWLRMGGRKPTFALPSGPSGIVEVLRIYYDLLHMAEDKGYLRCPHETTTEFQVTLERVIPRELVRAATAAFNRAFYGHHPATEEQIAQMRSSVQGLASGPS